MVGTLLVNHCACVSYSSSESMVGSGGDRRKPHAITTSLAIFAKSRDDRELPVRVASCASIVSSNPKPAVTRDRIPIVASSAEMTVRRFEAISYVPLTILSHSFWVYPTRSHGVEGGLSLDNFTGSVNLVLGGVAVVELLPACLRSFSLRDAISCSC